MIIAKEETKDTQPLSLVTVNVWMPDASPLKVVPVPVPERVAPPGLSVTVQEPLTGSPLSDTLPVATLQLGWVMDPNEGAAGVGGWALIKAEEEAKEMQPLLLVTVNV